MCVNSHLSGRQESGWMVISEVGRNQGGWSSRRSAGIRAVCGWSSQWSSGIRAVCGWSSRWSAGIRAVCGWSSRRSVGIRCVWVVISVDGRNQACLVGHLGGRQESGVCG